MKKEFKEILEKATVTIKWKNFGSWVEEDFINLLEAAQSKNLKITGTPDLIKIIYCDLNLKITRKTVITRLEQDVLAVIKMIYAYLGDKNKIYSRFGTSITN